MTNYYARACFDFHAPESGDLAFRQADVILVLNEIDENWLYGRLRSQIGSFPKSFVEKIQVPQTSDDQKLFAAVEDFKADIDGDLSFHRGDVILGLECIDTNWWKGQCASSRGIFPVTHVRELDLPLPQFDQVEFEPTHYSLETSSCQYIAKARAIMDLTAQLNDELSFVTGDTINIVNVQDATFGLGECNGHTGLFPLDFVEVFEGKIEAPKSKPHEALHKSKFNWFKDTDNTLQDSNRQTNMSTLYNNSATEKDESCFDATGQEAPAKDSRFHNHDGETGSTESDLLTYDAGVVPYDAASVPYDAASVPYDAAVVPYARTLFPFLGENPNELTFSDNELVTLLQHVDDQWILGQINGQEGIFPSSYAEIIVDCPWTDKSFPVMAEGSFYDTNGEMFTVFDYENKPKNGFRQEEYHYEEEDLAKENYVEPSVSLYEETPSCIKSERQCQEKPNHEGISAESIADSQTISTMHSHSSDRNYGLITHSYDAQGATDLSLMEGSTVEILGEADDLWLDVSTEDGQCGYFPKCYVSIIPDLPLASPSKPKPSIQPKPSPTQKMTNDLLTSVKVKPDCSPVFSHSRSNFQSSLDEMINMELQAAQKAETSTTKSKPPKPIPMDRAGKRIALKDMQVIQPKKVASSTFYVTSSGNNASNKIVPNRPAPPRPGPIAPRAKDLITFSPEKELPGFENDCQEVISDLKRRVKELEADIESFTRQLEMLQKQYDETPSEDLGEEVHDVQANIEGLTIELQKLQESLFQLEPQQPTTDILSDRRASEERHRVVVARQHAQNTQSTAAALKQRKEKRKHIVQEIIATEEEYVQSLKVAFEEAFSTDGSTVVKNSEPNFELLFGNMSDVIKVSETLLDKLKEVGAKVPDEQLIGPCFLDVKTDLLKVYSPYCRNHDDVINLLSKYEENAAIQEYFVKFVDKIRQQTTAFDLGSILIKPVQRILKYPLLLNELAKNTEESHMDKANILLAINTMTQVAAEINEYKRRKDLVKKYKVDRDEGFGDRLSRLTVHSTRKKFLRLSQKMVGSTTVDETFQREERRFHYLEITVKNVIRGLNDYMANLQTSLALMESVAADIMDLVGEQTPHPFVEQYCTTTNKMSTKLFNSHKEALKRDVLSALQQLYVMFQGPAKVIKKRHDKLLDYDRLASREASSTSTQGPQQTSFKEDVQQAKHDYEALNHQLLDELPQLCVLSSTLLAKILHKQLKLHQQISSQIVEEMEHLLGLELLATGSFLPAHEKAVEKLSQLTFCPKTFNPALLEEKGRMGPKVEQAASMDGNGVQTEGQKINIQQRYSQDKVWILSTDFHPQRPMDLSLQAGTIVGVIKESDPSGSKDYWFVDDGVQKGFVHCKCLTVWKEPLEKATESERYQAFYSFSARSDLEISLESGQIVTVTQKRDQDGNDEWWLVSDGELQGYVPANYLGKL